LFKFHYFVIVVLDVIWHCCYQHCTQHKVSVFKLLRGRFWGFTP